MNAKTALKKTAIGVTTVVAVMIAAGITSMSEQNDRMAAMASETATTNNPEQIATICAGRAMLASEGVKFTNQQRRALPSRRVDLAEALQMLRDNGVDRAGTKAFGEGAAKAWDGYSPEEAAAAEEQACRSELRAA